MGALFRSVEACHVRSYYLTGRNIDARWCIVQKIVIGLPLLLYEAYANESNLEKDNSLNHPCVSPKMGCLEYTN